jgi:hypothetical protein
LRVRHRYPSNRRVLPHSVQRARGRDPPAFKTQCTPKSRWIKASRFHPLIPCETKRWRDLYRGRAAVEREFGVLKHRYGLAPLRIRGLERVALHADLVMLARLGQALSRARAVPLAA